MKHQTLFLATTLAPAVLVAANTDTAAHEVTLAETTIVGATRIDTPIDAIGSSVSVVSEEQIRNLNAQNLQEALRQVPGLQFTNNGGPGTASNVYVRGSESSQTLVLINGIRVNSNTSGGFDFSSLPTHMIEKIEVLRGPQSGLYGSDALGGVVSITTKKGESQPLSGKLSGQYGELGYRQGEASVSGGNETFDYNASVSYYQLDKHDIAEDIGGTEDDPYDRLSAYLGLGYNFGEDGRVDFTTLYSEDENDLDGYKAADDPDRYSETDKIFTALSVTKPITDIYTQSLSAGYNRQETTGQAYSPYEYLTENYDASAKADFFTHDFNTLSLGYDFRYSEAENVGNFETEDRTQHAVFAQNQWNWEQRLFINVAGRYDDYDDIDSEETWKVDVSWYVLDNTRLHASAGTGFKLPTMNDLYWPDTGYQKGNPDLEPEKSDSFDFGVEQSFLNKALVADITYFKNDVENYINWAQDSGGVWTPSNLEDVELQGIEARLSYLPMEGLVTSIFYAWLDAEDTATGNELARRAEHTGGASVDWQCTKQTHLHASVTYTGDRYDDADNSIELDDFFLVTLGARYALTDNATLTVNISNAFDKDYQTADRYATPGRIASLGAELTF